LKANPKAIEYYKEKDEDTKPKTQMSETENLSKEELSKKKAMATIIWSLLKERE